MIETTSRTTGALVYGCVRMSSSQPQTGRQRSSDGLSGYSRARECMPFAESTGLISPTVIPRIRCVKDLPLGKLPRSDIMD